MKSKLLLLLLLFSTTIALHAKGVLIYGNGDAVSKVYSLPYSDEFMLTCEDGNDYHADLGVMYKQFSLFWVPIWNYGDYKFVLYVDKKIGNYDFTYLDLGKEEMDFLRSNFGGIPLEPELPFWDAYGGKLLLLVLIALALLFKGKDD